MLKGKTLAHSCVKANTSIGQNKSVFTRSQGKNLSEQMSKGKNINVQMCKG